jgi:hypothetical protein
MVPVEQRNRKKVSSSKALQRVSAHKARDFFAAHTLDLLEGINFRGLHDPLGELISEQISVALLCPIARWRGRNTIKSIGDLA